MEQTEKILFNYLKEIVDQIEATNDGTKERYLQCILFSKIINHESNSHKWSHLDVEKYFHNVGKKPCDLYFEEKSSDKAVWIEKKFLTSTNCKSSGAIQTPLIRDFLRLLFFPKPNLQSYDIENYVIMVAKCEYDVNKKKYYDPRSYFGIMDDPNNHPELSKLIYLPWKAEIEFDVQKYLKHLKSSKAKRKLIKDFQLKKLKHINISKYSYVYRNITHFDENTNPQYLEGCIFGYLFKILNYKRLDSLYDNGYEIR